MNEIIAQAEKNIRQAIEDYARHTNQTEVIEDISNAFIKRLAEDSSYAKQDLRKLFSKSPVWDEKIDALVINGTRTHNPDYNRIRELATDILWEPMGFSHKDKYETFVRAINYFAYPPEIVDKSDAIAAITELAPKAYAPGKKPSRIFKALCKEYGVVDETAGSEFQRLYAQFADELSSKKIGFKLYVSINPAHFLTMSNPKCDNRGSTLTSCHSLNSTQYEYNCGCVGYARDNVTFIVFTVSDPSEPETLNNRKTTRQIFAYKPGNGLLMQSRLYNTSGGTSGAQEESKLYRDLVQREISMLENVPNLWKQYILTNTKKINGASSLLFNHVFREFANKVEDDLYILPSSIHEVLIVQARGYSSDLPELAAMVRDVNNTEVAVDEILSYSVYKYSRDTDTLDIAVRGEEA